MDMEPFPRDSASSADTTPRDGTPHHGTPGRATPHQVTPREDPPREDTPREAALRVAAARLRARGDRASADPPRRWTVPFFYALTTRDARDHLSWVLRRVRRGEHVVITHAGVPVATVTPYGGEEPLRDAMIRVHADEALP